VKQSVGKTACLVGEALEITYFSGHNYLEVLLLTNCFNSLMMGNSMERAFFFLFWMKYTSSVE
jgi:hypothetical protein